jgi:nitrogen fixation protein FixH
MIDGRRAMPVFAIRRRAPAESRRSWIPYVFVFGMAVVLAANAALVWFALSSWTGLVAERPYERGIAYNRLIEAEARQTALGWRADVAFVAKPGGDGAGTIAITIVDANAEGLSGLVILASAERPLEDAAAIPLIPTYAGAGRYLADVDLPRRGQWDVRIHATRGEDTFIAVRRLIVP